MLFKCLSIDLIDTSMSDQNEVFTQVICYCSFLCVSESINGYIASGLSSP